MRERDDCVGVWAFCFGDGNRVVDGVEDRYDPCGVSPQRSVAVEARVLAASDVEPEHDEGPPALEVEDVMVWALGLVRVGIFAPSGHVGVEPDAVELFYSSL